MEETNKTTKTDLFKVDPRNIVVVDGFNSRVDFDLDPLKNSIKQNGVLNPITVVKFKDDNGNEKYRLVDGERRYRAVMSLLEEGVEIPRVPAIVVPKTNEAELLLQQVVRNEGKPFNEYEYGIACRKFEQFGFTRKEIAEKLGKDDGMITYYLQHLDRDEDVQELLKTNRISGSTVRRIYSGHKEDEKGAVEEIKQAQKKAEQKGKKVITMKDLDVNGKANSLKASKDIKKGLELLFEYYANYTNKAGLADIGLNLDISDILNELKNDKTIDEIMEKAVEAALEEIKAQEQEAV